MIKSIGLIGGTGPEGKGLAARYARAGLQVFIGSRAEDKGEAVAAELSLVTDRKVRGGTNAAAAEASEAVIVAVPYDGMRETLTALAPELRDKVVVSAVVPLKFSRASIAAIDVPDGSAAQEAQIALPQARITAAFHHLPAGHLFDLAHPIDGDVIVCGDDADARQQTIELAELIEGVRGINGGPLANSRYLEVMTVLILNINRIHKAETHIRVVGL